MFDLSETAYRSHLIPKQQKLQGEPREPRRSVVLLYSEYQGTKHTRHSHTHTSRTETVRGGSLRNRQPARRGVRARQVSLPSSFQRPPAISPKETRANVSQSGYPSKCLSPTLWSRSTRKHTHSPGSYPPAALPDTTHETAHTIGHRATMPHLCWACLTHSWAAALSTQARAFSLTCSTSSSSAAARA